MNSSVLPVLGGILRRVLKDEDFNFVWLKDHGELVIDGYIQLDPDEVRVVNDVLTEHE